MPPKRKPKKEDDILTELAQNTSSPSSSSLSDHSSQEGSLKKQKLEDSSTSFSSSQSGDDDDGSGLPMCVYGATCYRKNPDHFKQFRHPVAVSPPKPKPASKSKEEIPLPSTSSSSAPTTIINSSDQRLSNYLGILQFVLSKNKINADEKRLFRKHRKDNNITDQEHNALLKKLGWTEEEYEDGEKKDDEEIDLEEEKKYIEQDQFKIITIRKEDKNKSKEYSNVFSKVSSQFYDTMSKAQANFSISEIGVIVNPKLRKKYLTKKSEIMDKSGKDTTEETFGFHGTSKESIHAIANSGFLHPDDLAKLKAQSSKPPVKKGKTAKKYHAAPKPVEILDDGYYGRGIYFTLFSDYALWYSEERESNQLMLCKLLPGKRYQCTTRMDGEGLKMGYDSHCSPKGNEVVLFSADQILPRYIITFASKEAEEREQES